MSDSKKPSILTNAMQIVDAKLNRTPAEGEETTPETKTAFKRIAIGAGLIVAGTAGLIVAVKLGMKSVEEENATSDENIED
jgi:hypothetical protein